MLYYLFNYLQKCNFPGAGVFNYVTFRAAMAVILALIVSVWFGNYFINLLKRKKVVETQRDEKTDPYNIAKKGVPTMGGVIIIAAILIPVLFVSKLHSVYTILMIATTLILGALGFADDYIKTFRKKKDGLKPKVKLGGQILLGLIVGLTLRFSPAVQINETVQVKIENNQEVVVKSPDVKSTRTTIPFVKNHNLNYADLFKWAGERWMYNLAWIFLVLLTVFIVAAVSNGSNLNDGMDGLCAGNAAIMCIALGILAYVSSHIHMAAYLNIMFIPGSEELVIFLCAFVGALIGFLWYNAYPAQVFMGDTGSLAIGGIIGVMAIIIHKELLLPLLCFVFFMESLSVLLQTNYAKMGNRRGEKWRVIKRAPLHDTFRVAPGQLPANFKVLINWPKGCWLESKITVRFWIVTIIMSALAIVTLKIR